MQNEYYILSTRQLVAIKTLAIKGAGRDESESILHDFSDPKWCPPINIVKKLQR
jgi:hypothetical protein